MKKCIVPATTTTATTTACVCVLARGLKCSEEWNEYLILKTNSAKLIVQQN